MLFIYTNSTVTPHGRMSQGSQLSLAKMRAKVGTINTNDCPGAHVTNADNL